MSPFRLAFATAVAASLALAACSSTAPRQGQPLVASAPRIAVPLDGAGELTTGFTGSGLWLTFTRDGHWQRIVSTASVRIVGRVPGAADDALTVATMKARRQLAEFIQVRITSSRSLQTISRAVQRSGAQAADDAHHAQDGSDASMRIAQRVSDRITQTSRAILRGTLVRSAYIDAERGVATVTVTVDRRSAAMAAGMEGFSK